MLLLLNQFVLLFKHSINCERKYHVSSIFPRQGTNKSKNKPKIKDKDKILVNNNFSTEFYVCCRVISVAYEYL